MRIQIFKKLKYYKCEFRTRLAREGKGDKWWNFTDSESKNIKIIDEVILCIKKYALPIIDGLIKDSRLFERVRIADVKNRFIPIPDFKSGLTPMTTDIRLAWALAVVVEKTNPKKSLEFAKYALKHGKSPSTFFGTADLNRIIESYKDNQEKDLTTEDMSNVNAGFWTRITDRFKKQMNYGVQHAIKNTGRKVLNLNDITLNKSLGRQELRNALCFLIANRYGKWRHE